MRPFKFKLETVLNLRLKEEEQQQLRLNVALRNRDEASNVLEMLKQRQKKYQGLLRKLLDTDPTGLQAASLRDYLPTLADRLFEQHQLLEQMEKAVIREREVLLDIVRNRKIIEKLKAKSYFNYTREALREEQNRIDEMANQLYFRREVTKP